MIEIKELLSNLNSVLLSAELKRNSIADVLRDIIGIDVKPEDIKIKNNTVYLNIKPIYKNEILLKKEDIFKKIKEVLGKKTPENII